MLKKLSLLLLIVFLAFSHSYGQSTGILDVNTNIGNKAKRYMLDSSLHIPYANLGNNVRGVSSNIRGGAIAFDVIRGKLVYSTNGTTYDKVLNDSLSGAVPNLQLVTTVGAYTSNPIEIRYNSQPSGIVYANEIYFSAFNGSTYTKALRIRPLAYRSWTSTNNNMGFDFWFIKNGFTTESLALRYSPFGKGCLFISNNDALGLDSTNQLFVDGKTRGTDQISSDVMLKAPKLTLTNVTNTSTPGNILSIPTGDSVIISNTFGSIVAALRDSLNINSVPQLTYPDFALFSGSETRFGGNYYGTSLYGMIQSIGKGKDGGILVSNLDSVQNSLIGLGDSINNTVSAIPMFGITFSGAQVYAANSSTYSLVSNTRDYRKYMIYRTAADSTVRLYGSNDGVTFSAPLFIYANKMNRQLNVSVYGVANQMTARIGVYNVSARICILGNSTEAKIYGQDSVGKTVFTADERINKGYDILNLSIGGNKSVDQMNVFLGLSRAEQLSFSSVCVFTGLNDVVDSPRIAALAYQKLVDTLRAKTRKGCVIIGYKTTPTLFIYTGGNATLYKARLDSLNDNIMGVGYRPISGLNYIVDGHNTELNNGVNGALLSSYYGLNDGIHLASLAKKIVDKWIGDALVKTNILNRVTYPNWYAGPDASLQNQTAKQLQLLIPYLPQYSTTKSKYFCTDCIAPDGSLGFEQIWTGINWVYPDNSLRYTISTTGSSTTTIASIPIPTGKRIRIVADVKGKNGANDIRGVKTALIRNDAGTLTTLGTVVDEATTQSDVALTTASFTITFSGTNAIVQVTGVAATNIDWIANIKYILD